MEEGDARKVNDRDYGVRFIMSELKAALTCNEDIKKELEMNKKADYTVSITGPSGLKLTGTIIIKEEE